MVVLEEASVKLRFASIKETYLTGSYPEPPKGWHLSTRHIPRQTPHTIPFFSTASIIYWEQVGSYRHDGCI